MVDCIVQTWFHCHVYNIDDIDNCYCLCNCLFCGHVVYEGYCHSHSHLYLDNCCSNYCYSYTRRIKLPMVTLKLASIIILLSPSPLLGPSVWPPTVILASIGSGSSYLCLHTALPVQGEGEVVEVAVVILLYLCFSFLCDL